MSWLGFSIAVNRPHNIRQLLQMTFNGGWLSVSELQSIIIMVESLAAYRQTWLWTSGEFYTLIRRQPGEERLPGSKEKGLQAYPCSDTLSSTRPRLLRIPLPMGRGYSSYHH